MLINLAEITDPVTFSGWTDFFMLVLHVVCVCVCVCVYMQVASLSQADYGLLTAHSAARGLHVIVLRSYTVYIIAICGLVKSVFAQTGLLCSQKDQTLMYTNMTNKLCDACMSSTTFFIMSVWQPSMAFNGSSIWQPNWRKSNFCSLNFRY